MSQSVLALVSTCRQMVAAILFGAVLLAPVALFVLAMDGNRDATQRLAAHSMCSYGDTSCSSAFSGKGPSFSIR